MTHTDTHRHTQTHTVTHRHTQTHTQTHTDTHRHTHAHTDIANAKTASFGVNASAAEIQAELERLLGAGNASVTENGAGSWVVSFIGSQNYQDLTTLTPN